MTSSELEILRAIQREGGVAGVTTISAACDLTSGYVDFLCRYLKRGGYLLLAGRSGVYQLTPKGEAAMGRTALELPPPLPPPTLGGEEGGARLKGKARWPRPSIAPFTPWPGSWSLEWVGAC